MTISAITLLALLAFEQAGQSTSPPAAVMETWDPIIYFDSDEWKLTTAGLAVVQRIASYLAGKSPTQVSIVAHSDSSGPAPYNMRLSRRRAQTIADALIQAGLDPKLIRVASHGESRPAVPVAEGVSEPLNRRATIDWR